MTINTFCKISCFGITLMWCNCSTHENKKNTNVVEQEPVVVNLSGDPSKDPIGWSKTDSVKIKLDSTLSHQSAGFACDSAQSAIYIGCAGLESSARLGSETFHDEVMHSNIFNLKTLRKWAQICQALQFSDCKNWSDLKDSDE